MKRVLERRFSKEDFQKKIFERSFSKEVFQKKENYNYDR